MPSDDTQYRFDVPEPDPEEELESLDWSNLENPPVEAAAELIHEILSEPDPENRRSLHEMLAEMPPDFRPEVVATLLRQNVEKTSYGAMGHPPEGQSDNGNDPPEWARGQNPGRDDASSQHTSETGLHWDQELTRETLDYVEENCGYQDRDRLEQAILDSRNLEPLREALEGNPILHDATSHQKFVGCVVDLRAAVEAKEAMEATHGVNWAAEEREAAVRHEVNRMGYRLLLEIEERLLRQVEDTERTVQLAKERNLIQQVVEMLEDSSTQVAQWLTGTRETDEPTEQNILTAIDIYRVWIIMEQATERGDEYTIQTELRGEPVDTDETTGFSYALDPAVHRAIRGTAEIARRWQNEDIQEGATNYRVPRTDIEFTDSNRAREEWLTTTAGANRNRYVRDCFTRALNDLAGGDQYGQIHDTVSQIIKQERPERDADHGLPGNVAGEVLMQYGMQPVLDANSDYRDPMRKHLDIREIPTLLGHLFPDPDHALTFVATPERHAAAVIDGVLHDSVDWTDAMDNPQARERSAVNGIWISCDDEDIMREAREIIEKYRQVRDLDEAMTRGVIRRQTTTPRRVDDELIE